MHELIAKAESGDRSAMCNLGMEYLQHGDGKSAEQWWIKAAEMGSQAAMQYLAVLLYPNTKPENPFADNEKFLYRLKQLALEGDSAWGKIMLGALYCGVLHSNLRQTYTVRELHALRNKPEGIRLMEQGIAQAKEVGLALNFLDYEVVADVYLARNQIRQSGKQPLSNTAGMEDALVYFKKMLSAGMPEQYMNDHRKMIAQLEEDISGNRALQQRIAVFVKEAEKVLEFFNTLVFTSSGKEKEIKDKLRWIISEAHNNIHAITTREVPATDEMLVIVGFKELKDEFSTLNKRAEKLVEAGEIRDPKFLELSEEAVSGIFNSVEEILPVLDNMMLKTATIEKVKRRLGTCIAKDAVYGGGYFAEYVKSLDDNYFQSMAESIQNGIKVLHTIKGAGKPRAAEYITRLELAQTHINEIKKVTETFESFVGGKA